MIVEEIKKTKTIEETVLDYRKVAIFSGISALSLSVLMYLFYPIENNVTLKGVIYTENFDKTVESPSSGRIDSVNVNEGDIVNKDQKIIRFYDENASNNLANAWFLLWDAKTEIQKLKAFSNGKEFVEYGNIEGDALNKAFIGLKNQKSKELAQMYIEKSESKTNMDKDIEDMQEKQKDIEKSIADVRERFAAFEKITKERMTYFTEINDARNQFLQNTFDAKTRFRIELNDKMQEKFQTSKELNELATKRRDYDKEILKAIDKKYNELNNTILALNYKISEITSSIKQETMYSKENSKINKIFISRGDDITVGQKLFTITPENREFDIISFVTKEVFDNLNNEEDAVVVIDKCKKHCTITGKVDKESYVKKFGQRENKDLYPVIIKTEERDVSVFDKYKWEILKEDFVTITVIKEKKSRVFL
jgi:multidrug efflux pump subunit AcrA (membrane-fusion protein)